MTSNRMEKDDVERTRPMATPERAPPLAGVLIGTAISLVLWAMIAGTVLILR